MKNVFIKKMAAAPIILTVSFQNINGIILVQDNSVLAQMITQINAINEVITNAQKQVEFANKINSTLNDSYKSLTSLNAGLADPTAILDTAKQNYESVKYNLKRLEENAKNRDYLNEVYGKQWNRCYSAYQKLKTDKTLAPEQQTLFDEGFKRILEVQSNLDAELIGWNKNYKETIKEDDDEGHYSFKNVGIRAISVREAQSNICKAMMEAEKEAGKQVIKHEITKCIDRKNTTCLAKEIDKLETLRQEAKNKEIEDEQAELADIIDKANNRLRLRVYEKDVEEKIKKGKLESKDIQKLLSNGDYQNAIQAQMQKMINTLSNEEVDLRSIAIESLEISNMMLKQQNEILQTMNETNKAVSILVKKIDRRKADVAKDNKKLKEEKEKLAELRKERFDNSDICYDVYGNIKSLAVESSRTCKKVNENDRKIIEYTEKDKK